MKPKLKFQEKKLTDPITDLSMRIKPIKCKKPNIFRRFACWTGLMKDPYDGSKAKYFTQDEIGQWPR